MSSVKWLPLESNPDVMNKFLENLGVPKKWAITDVISLDDELLSLVPSPVLAVLLLYQVNPVHDEFRKKQEADMLASGLKISGDVYFMKQTIKNACGTVALIHAVANNKDRLDLESSSTLAKFLKATKSLSPEDRGKELENASDIEAAHKASAQEGQTEPPSPDEQVDLHFVAFVNIDNQIYEFDGRKDKPVYFGPTTSDTFMKDAAKICRDFMKRDPENMKFTVLALAPSAN